MSCSWCLGDGVEIVSTCPYCSEQGRKNREAIQEFKDVLYEEILIKTLHLDKFVEWLHRILTKEKP